jgi:2-polyprenyl-6-hydroxyphenyl methylase/3-demethylubiquinone-9 3-methyltransferase
VKRELDRLGLSDKRIFDLGCGNGSHAQWLSEQGYRVTGVDPSASGIAKAQRAFPNLQFETATTGDDLAARFGTFPVVISLEVVEHCFSARRFATSCYTLLEPGGALICSTPYHGYIKNLALSLVGGWDRHHTSLDDGNHIKFFSVRTLGALLRAAGFRGIRFVRVGRIPPLAKSMIAIAIKPLAA